METGLTLWEAYSRLAVLLVHPDRPPTTNLTIERAADWSNRWFDELEAVKRKNSNGRYLWSLELTQTDGKWRSRWVIDWMAWLEHILSGGDWRWLMPDESVRHS